ncbi:hypothetical protein [Clostridium manihotivorum]|nr:hypothetical protein [Clostridium manihotivorum]
MKNRASKIIISVLLLAVVAVPVLSNKTSIGNIGGIYPTSDWPDPIDPK